MLFKVAWHSLVNRRLTVFLTVLSITVSVFVLLSVEHIRQEAKNSFNKTVSGVDLIVGPRTGSINLLLYSVFRIGSASNTISLDSYNAISSSSLVAWSIPIALGDSHQGFPVMATTSDYFQYFKYGNQQPLIFKEGRAFDKPYEAVLGKRVAETLGYKLLDELTLSHGTGVVSFTQHDDQPFKIVGILEATGTPVDQTVHIDLPSLEALHADQNNAHEHEHEHELPMPERITAFMLGLKSKALVLSAQRNINNFSSEPLLSIVPALTLSELWRLMASVEYILWLIAILVLLAALFGMSTMILASMRERQRELAVLRAIGGAPMDMFVLIEIEVLLIASFALILAFMMTSLGFYFAQGLLSEHYGLFISASLFNASSIWIITMVFIATFVMGLLPAIQAYYGSLHNGLLTKV